MSYDDIFVIFEARFLLDLRCQLFERHLTDSLSPLADDIVVKVLDGKKLHHFVRHRPQQKSPHRRSNSIIASSDLGSRVAGAAATQLTRSKKYSTVDPRSTLLWMVSAKIMAWLGTQTPSTPSTLQYLCGAAAISLLHHTLQQPPQQQPQQPPQPTHPHTTTSTRMQASA